MFYQGWLFGYELHDFIVVFSKKAIVILTSKKKVEFLKSIENKENEEGVPPVTLLVRERADKDAANYDRLLSTIAKSGEGRVIGVFAKDKASGEFTDDWKERLDARKFESVDISLAFAYVSATKDEAEVAMIRKAATFSCDLYGKYLREEITEIIDSDRKVKHSKLAKNVENAMNNDKYIKGADIQYLDLCYGAIIQSGGNYSLKFSTVSDDNFLHFGAITCSLGLRYKQYCSNLIRTLLVNPTEEQKALYEFLLTVHEGVLDKLRADVRLCDVYQTAVDMVAKRDKALMDKFTKNCGFAMGIEFREGSLMLAPKSRSLARKGMVFNVALGFSGLENKEATDKEGKTYALFIGDTVLVNGSDSPATCLTTSKKRLKNIAVIIKDDDEVDEEEEMDDSMDGKKFDSGKKKSNGVNDVEAVMKGAYGRGRRTAVVETKLRVSGSCCLFYKSFY